MMFQPVKNCPKMGLEQVKGSAKINQRFEISKFF